MLKGEKAGRGVVITEIQYAGSEEEEGPRAKVSTQPLEAGKFQKWDFSPDPPERNAHIRFEPGEAHVRLLTSRTIREYIVLL